jgi:CheY-like chemotaxis protein
VLREKPQIRLVLADVRMPGMDGTDLARAIARQRPEVRVVLTSGYVGEDQVAGFPFVPKPWRADIIAAVVEGK